MTGKSEIENELVVAAKFKAKRSEIRQAYLKRLVASVYKLPDDVWGALSPEAQDWYNGAAEENKAGDEISDFPDLPEVDLSVPDERIGKKESAKEVVVEEKESEEQSADEEEPAKAAPARPGRKVSACHAIKTLVVKKPSITVSDLSEKLKSKGLKVSDVTIASLRSDVRDTLRVLNELEMGEFIL